MFMHTPLYSTRKADLKCVTETLSECEMCDLRIWSETVYIFKEKEKTFLDPQIMTLEKVEKAKYQGPILHCRNLSESCLFFTLEK